MKIYLATWPLEVSQGKALTKVGKKERPVSYYHILPKRDQLVKYIKTGRNE